MIRVQVSLGTFESALTDWPGFITLLRHPAQRTGLGVLLAANDDEGLELASRLLPLRTGVPVRAPLLTPAFNLRRSVLTPP